MGTTRMDADPRRGVVDTDARVHGLENLYVAGSSVFPTGLGYANPTLVVVALAIRLAEHLKALRAGAPPDGPDRARDAVVPEPGRSHEGWSEAAQPRPARLGDR